MGKLKKITAAAAAAMLLVGCRYAYSSAKGYYYTCLLIRTMDQGTGSLRRVLNLQVLLFAGAVMDLAAGCLGLYYSLKKCPGGTSLKASAGAAGAAFFLSAAGTWASLSGAVAYSAGKDLIVLSGIIRLIPNLLTIVCAGIHFQTECKRTA